MDNEQTDRKTHGATRHVKYKTRDLHARIKGEGVLLTLWYQLSFSFETAGIREYKNKFGLVVQFGMIADFYARLVISFSAGKKRICVTLALLLCCGYAGDKSSVGGSRI